MIIIDELPFCFVENKGFEDVQPKFYVVSRTQITKDCLKLYFNGRNKLMEYFKVLPSHVCITTDLWTSIQNLGYMVLTVHFVDKEWKLHQKIISFRVLPHPHSGEAIAKAMESCLMEWSLMNVMTITRDNAKNNDKCVEDLTRRMNRRNGVLLGGEYFYVRCFAHVINLIVGDEIAEVKGTVKRLRPSVKNVRSSPSHLQMFKKCALEEMIKSKKSLCLDIKTRWNSTYLMIDAAMKFEKAFDKFSEHDINFVFECNVKNKGVMGEIDWKKLKALHLFLEEFYELTKRVSGSKYVISNTYFDELTQVKDLIMDLLESDDMMHFFVIWPERWIQSLISIASLSPSTIFAIVLDPRYKLQYMEFWYSSYLERVGILTKEQREKEVEAFTKKLKDLWNVFMTITR